jgi:hypothetical protein
MARANIAYILSKKPRIITRLQADIVKSFRAETLRR